MKCFYDLWEIIIYGCFMEWFYDLEKLECFYDLEKLELFYDLQKLFHFINSIYYTSMREIEEGNGRIHGEWSQGRGR